MTFFVLWIYLAQPWSMGAVPMTLGWLSTYQFESFEECYELAQAQTLSTMCLPEDAPIPSLLSILRPRKA